MSEFHTQCGLDGRYWKSVRQGEHFSIVFRLFDKSNNVITDLSNIKIAILVRRNDYITAQSWSNYNAECTLPITEYDATNGFLQAVATADNTAKWLDGNYVLEIRVSVNNAAAIAVARKAFVVERSNIKDVNL